MKPQRVSIYIEQDEFMLDGEITWNENLEMHEVKFLTEGELKSKLDSRLSVMLKDFLDEFINVMEGIDETE